MNPVPEAITIEDDGERRSPANVYEDDPPQRLLPHEKILLAIVLLLTFGCMASALTFPFVYDDHPQIEGNAFLHWHDLGTFFTRPLWHWITGASIRFYRPMLLVWLLVCRTLFGLNPFGYHLMSLLAHVAVTALVFVVGRMLLRNNLAAIVGAAIFGVHPMHVESAVWVSDANDLLAALGMLGALAFLQRALRSHGRAWRLEFFASMACFVVALLAKEISVVFPVLAAVEMHRSKGASAARRTIIGSLMVAVTGLFLLVRWLVIPESSGPRVEQPLAAVIFSVPSLMVFYLKKSVWPAGLSLNYDVSTAQSGTAAEFVLPLIVILTIGGLLAWAMQRPENRPALIAASAWFLLPLLPALNLRFTYQSDPVHDRYAYVSGIGIAFLAGWIYSRLAQKARTWKPLALMATVVVIGLAAAAQVQTWTWSSDPALFSNAVKMAPQNPWAHLNWGAMLSYLNRWDEAEKEFTESFALLPGNQTARYAGLAAQHQGDYARAEDWFRKGLELEPADLDSRFQLGITEYKLGRANEAEKDLRVALAAAPDADGWHYALGRVLEQQGRQREALEQYRDELAEHPERQDVRSKVEELSKKL